MDTELASAEQSGELREFLRQCDAIHPVEETGEIELTDADVARLQQPEWWTSLNDEAVGARSWLVDLRAVHPGEAEVWGECDEVVAALMWALEPYARMLPKVSAEAIAADSELVRAFRCAVIEVRALYEAIGSINSHWARLQHPEPMRSSHEVAQPSRVIPPIVERPPARRVRRREGGHSRQAERKRQAQPRDRSPQLVVDREGPLPCFVLKDFVVQPGAATYREITNLGIVLDEYNTAVRRLAWDGFADLRRVDNTRLQALCGELIVIRESGQELIEQLSGDAKRLAVLSAISSEAVAIEIRLKRLLRNRGDSQAPEEFLDAKYWENLIGYVALLPDPYGRLLKSIIAECATTIQNGKARLGVHGYLRQVQQGKEPTLRDNLERALRMRPIAMDDERVKNQSAERYKQAVVIFNTLQALYNRWPG